MSEIRKDPLTGTWVVIATERAKRPSDFKRKREPETHPASCPFCPGQEASTPPEICAVRPEGSSGVSGWTVRAFANKFPAVEPAAGSPAAQEATPPGDGLFVSLPGVGAHEVIVDTPGHDRRLQDEGPKGVADLLAVLQGRYRDLTGRPGQGYVQLFKNHGAVAGASLTHSHCQLITTPDLPQRVRQEVGACLEYAAGSGQCLVCDLVRAERRGNRRVVADYGEALVLTPYASRFPFEMLVLPAGHTPDFGQASAGQLEAMARALHTALSRLDRVADDPPYNLVVHSLPACTAGLDEALGRAVAQGRFHWHIEILPRLTKIAGFEFGSGYFINPTPPELACRCLRLEGGTDDGDEAEVREEAC